MIDLAIEAIMPLRIACFFLIFANLCWLGPVALKATKGGPVEGFPNAAFTIPLVGLMLGVGGFQSAYLFESVPQILHWRKAVNLAIVDVSLLLFFVMGMLRLRDLR